MKIAVRTILTGILACAVTVSSAQRRMAREEYILKYKQYAVETLETHGIPASITMAQALLESDDGNSRLATLGNNHFGIKCKSYWTGKTISHTDDAKDECFRKYDSVEESFLDHAEFLDKTERYQSLFDLDPKDYRAWAHGLKAAGYATNPVYAELLIKIVEDHQLYLLDEETGKDYIVIAEVPEAPVMTEVPVAEELGGTVDIDNYVVSVTRNGRTTYMNNGSEFTLAKAGDSYELLASSFGIAPKRLRKNNDVSEFAQLKEGDMVYLKAKSKRALNGNLMHVVKSGETLYGLSQQYGIRLKNLARLNGLSTTSTIAPGQQIRLM